MKRIVILGGGFAGTLCAKKFEHEFDTTLVDTKDYFEFTPGILRTIIEPDHALKIQVKHAQYLKKTRFINGEATSITDSTVLIRNKKIPFDYLILCSGSTYAQPIKQKNVVLATRAQVLKKYHEKLEHAKNILIIGGGIVGVELAAEIITAHLDKNVTIVQSKNTLLERSTSKAQSYARHFLVKRGVHVLLNERIIGNKGKMFITNKKTRITTTLPFLCTGIAPNSRFMKKHFLNSLTNKQYILVNDYLQVHDCTTIFAGGDLTSIPEEKTAQNAEEHAKIIVKNIYHLENNQPLEPYLPAPRLMVISLGKYYGILTYKKFTITGIIPGLLKTLIEKIVMLRYR